MLSIYLIIDPFVCEASNISKAARLHQAIEI
jgi:hypothetical protein